MNKAYGYERWKSMGRQVKKGEKAIRIIAPAQVKEKRQQKNWMRKTNRFWMKMVIRKWKR